MSFSRESHNTQTVDLHGDQIPIAIPLISPSRFVFIDNPNSLKAASQPERDTNQIICLQILDLQRPFGPLDHAASLKIAL